MCLFLQYFLKHKASLATLIFYQAGECVHSWTAGAYDSRDTVQLCLSVTSTDAMVNVLMTGCILHSFFLYPSIVLL